MQQGWDWVGIARAGASILLVHFCMLSGGIGVGVTSHNVGGLFRDCSLPSKANIAPHVSGLRKESNSTTCQMIVS